MKEKWKNIKGYKGFYQASNLGNIKRMPKKIKKIAHHNQKDVFWNGKILRQFNNRGYKKLELCKKGVRKSYGVHRLVALAFIPNPKNKPYINHKNAIRSDNRVENLEWVTPQENDLHSVKLGIKRVNSKGEKHPMAKLSEKQVILIRKNAYKPLKDLAKEFKVSFQAISDIINRKRWKHI